MKQGSVLRTIDWTGEHIVIIEQTLLPHSFTHITLTNTDEVIDAIKRLAVRGAPAIGVTGALGVAMLAMTARDSGQPTASILADAERIANARPTAVNLRWAVDRVLRKINQGHDAIINEAVAMMHEDIATNEAMTSRAADVLLELCGKDMLSLHTHCNTGDLATVEGGTALGAAFQLYARGKLREVIADETRPLLQGARLTAFELAERGIPYRVSADGAGPTCIARGLVDAVVIGADRIAANGDTANKVGSYPLALAAKRAGIPFVVVAPESTLDPATLSGHDIHIELRADEEVTMLNGIAIAPIGAKAVNFAFDITPHDLIAAIVTEYRVIYPSESLTITPWIRE
jgi:methylthioribose-1-phosphate isomerase